MKQKVLDHINHIHKGIVPTKDVSGGYYQYPMQSILTIIKNGKISLSLAMIFNLSKKDFRPNKEFSSVELIELTSPAYKYNYQVEITLNKDINTSIEYKDAPNLIKWRNTYNYGFNTFQEANELYTKMVTELNLTDNVYNLYRYNQHIKGEAPEYTYDEYIKLITTNVDTL